MVSSRIWMGNRYPWRQRPQQVDSQRPLRFLPRGLTIVSFFFACMSKLRLESDESAFFDFLWIFGTRIGRQPHEVILFRNISLLGGKIWSCGAGKFVKYDKCSLTLGLRPDPQHTINFHRKANIWPCRVLIGIYCPFTKYQTENCQYKVCLNAHHQTRTQVFGSMFIFGHSSHLRTPRNWEKHAGHVSTTISFHKWHETTRENLHQWVCICAMLRHVVQCMTISCILLVCLQRRYFFFMDWHTCSTNRFADIRMNWHCEIFKPWKDRPHCVAAIGLSVT